MKFSVKLLGFVSLTLTCGISITPLVAQSGQDCAAISCSGTDLTTNKNNLTKIDQVTSGLRIEKNRLTCQPPRNQTGAQFDDYLNDQDDCKRLTNAVTACNAKKTSCTNSIANEEKRLREMSPDDAKQFANQSIQNAATGGENRAFSPKSDPDKNKSATTPKVSTTQPPTSPTAVTSPNADPNDDKTTPTAQTKIQSRNSDYQNLKNANSTRQERIDSRVLSMREKRDEARKTYWNAETDQAGHKSNKDSLKIARQDLRNAKSEQRANNRENRKIEKEFKKDNQLKANAEFIRTDEDRSNYGGKYGGANKETTEIINAGAQMAQQTAQQTLAQAQARAGQARTQNLSAQGQALSQQALLDAQDAEMKDTSKHLNTTGGITAGLALIQAWRGFAHSKSKSKVAKSAEEANKQIKIEEGILKSQMATLAIKTPGLSLASCTSKIIPNLTDPAQIATFNEICEADKQLQQQKTNVGLNKTGETAAQKQAAIAQYAVAGAAAANAAQQFMQAGVIDRARGEMKHLAELNTPKYSFNIDETTQDNPQNNDPGTGEAQNEAILASTADIAEQFDSGEEPFNPGMFDPNSQAGPAAGQFNSNPNGNGQGGGAGGGMGGGAAGTSAAQDDSKKGEEGPTAKGQAGGQYAGTDGGSGSKFSKSGGGNDPVGQDPNFLDMLKKLLPNSDEGLAKEDLAADEADRLPAGDSAAVLGRNQNIFEAIHKRYLKKKSEGAISI